MASSAGERRSGNFDGRGRDFDVHSYLILLVTQGLAVGAGLRVVANDTDFWGCLNAKLDDVAADPDHGDLNLITDQNLLSLLSAEY